MPGETSKMCNILRYPSEPIKLFTDVLSRLDSFVAMNLATIDKEFGVLNRTVVYRGLTDDAITFVTERNSRKYANLKESPKLGVTFLFPVVPNIDENKEQIWQIRLLNAEAFELNEEAISKLWNKEPLFAKIRSHICVCGKPVQHEELKEKHDQLLKAFESGKNKLEQTNTYTAFKIIPQIWDFYVSEQDSVADRIEYTRNGESWKVTHVAA